MSAAPHQKIALDVERCIGCQACAVACRVECNVPPGRFRTKVYSWDEGTWLGGGVPNATAFPIVERSFPPAPCPKALEFQKKHGKESTVLKPEEIAKTSVSCRGHETLHGRAESSINGRRQRLDAWNEKVIAEDQDLNRDFWWGKPKRGTRACCNVNANVPIQPASIAGMQGRLDSACSNRAIALATRS